MILFALSGVSCKKYLDVTPDNVGTIDYAFRNRNEAENYLFTCYSTLQQLVYPQYNPGFTTSGEIIFPNNLSDNQGIDPVGFNLIRGFQNTANPGLDYWDGYNGGQGLFTALRRCNTLLENIDKPVDLSVEEKKRWIAEVKFLKAYYHFYLFRLYGPIPITDVNIPINSSPEEVKVKRNSVDDVVNYMVSLLDQAAPDLPLVIQNQARELGRVTQPVALAIKAQVLATAASPLFNGNQDYLSLKNKDGELLFPAGFQSSKWDKASVATLEAINSARAAGARLHQFIPTSSVGNLSDSLKTVLTLQTAITEKWELNPEVIWALNPYYPTQPNGAPRLTARATANPTFPGTFAVPISQQELFYTKNGVPMDEDKSFDYAARYELRTGNAASRFYIGNGYTTIKAHFDREPRFYADLGFDGGIWFGNGQLNQESLYFVKARGSSSFAGPVDNVRVNVTACWPKKLVNYLTVQDEGISVGDFRLPVIRLASLYLLYAEILNEQGKSTSEVTPWIDEVRKRAGLPGVVDSWTRFSRTPDRYGSKEGMRQIIHRESRIELAFEGEVGWSLRRWKELQSVLSRPMQGWSIYESEAANFYRPTTVLTPVFNLRNYLWPLHSYALLVNDKLVQNPGW